MLYNTYLLQREKNTKIPNGKNRGAGLEESHSKAMRNKMKKKEKSTFNKNNQSDKYTKRDKRDILSTILCAEK